MDSSRTTLLSCSGASPEAGVPPATIRVRAECRGPRHPRLRIDTAIPSTIADRARILCNDLLSRVYKITRAATTEDCVVCPSCPRGLQRCTITYYRLVCDFEIIITNPYAIVLIIVDLLARSPFLDIELPTEV